MCPCRARIRRAARSSFRRCALEIRAPRIGWRPASRSAAVLKASEPASGIAFRRRCTPYCGGAAPPTWSRVAAFASVAIASRVFRASRRVADTGSLRSFETARTAVPIPRSLMVANTAGWDTDCNGATVGGLWGLSGEPIPAHWTRPWQERVAVTLAGIDELGLGDLVDRTVAVARSLA